MRTIENIIIKYKDQYKVKNINSDSQTIISCGFFKNLDFGKFADEGKIRIHSLRDIKPYFYNFDFRGQECWSAMCEVLNKYYSENNFSMKLNKGMLDKLKSIVIDSVKMPKCNLYLVESIGDDVNNYLGVFCLQENWSPLRWDESIKEFKPAGLNNYMSDKALERFMSLERRVNFNVEKVGELYNVKVSDFKKDERISKYGYLDVGLEDVLERD